MNELERRISTVLTRNASPFTRTMPPRTVARIRTRQAFNSFVTLGLVAGLVFGMFLILSGVPRASYQPGDRQTVAPPTRELPSPQGTPGGISDANAVSASAIANEDTSATSTHSWEPYTDQVEGQELYLNTQKHVVADGHVTGIEWSLAAFDTKMYTGNLFTPHLGGPCGDLFVGDQGDYGGIEFCLHTDETSPGAQFALAGFGNNSDPIAGPITGYAGLVGPAVSSVELRSADGTTSEIALYDAPQGIDARYFAVFLDAGTTGTIVAMGSDGADLGHGRLCIGRVPRAPDNVGCGRGLQGLASVVTNGP